MLFSVAILITRMNRCEGTKIANIMSLSWHGSCGNIATHQRDARLWCMASAKGLSSGLSQRVLCWVALCKQVISLCSPIRHEGSM
jgi:hypothetical protein